MLFFKKVKKLFKDPELFFHDYNIKKRAKNSLIIKKLGNSHIPYSTYTIVSDRKSTRLNSSHAQ